jgi:hypothetical protein
MNEGVKKGKKRKARNQNKLNVPLTTTATACCRLPAVERNP